MKSISTAVFFTPSLQLTRKVNIGDRVLETELSRIFTKDNEIDNSIIQLGEYFPEINENDINNDYIIIFLTLFLLLHQLMDHFSALTTEKMRYQRLFGGMMIDGLL